MFSYFADKINNIYKVSPEQNKNLLKENVTQTYKKPTDLLEKSINLEAKILLKELRVIERVCLTKNPTFITLKDSK